MLGWSFFPNNLRLFDYQSRDFSPNLKQDLSGLSGFFRQLHSKSCFIMSGLSGFWTVYLQKPLKNYARFERFWAVYLKKKNAQTAQTAQILLENRLNCPYLERFLSGISTRALYNLLITLSCTSFILFSNSSFSVDWFLSSCKIGNSWWKWSKISKFDFNVNRLYELVAMKFSDR